MWQISSVSVTTDPYPSPGLNPSTTTTSRIIGPTKRTSTCGEFRAIFTQ